MGLYYDQNLSASPVVVLQPQQHMPQAYNMNSDERTMAPYWPQQIQSQTPSSAAGRKRSRDEAAGNLEDDSYFPPATEATQESEEGWEYGEGMTLIRPNGFIIDASSQTGTWAEEKAALSQPQIPVSQPPQLVHDRPNLRNHKSQRLDLTATPVIDEEISLSNGTVVAASPPKMTPEDPTVDAFTVHLGIGWSRISDDEHIQAAARGWAKFIENHYPVNFAQIRLQSKGLASYLVEANEGWFLFSEDLKEGRLVSTSLEKTFENLRTSPPVFDGYEVLVAAAETPKPDMQTKPEFNMGEPGVLSVPEVLTNGFFSTNGPVQEVMTGGPAESQAPTAHNLEVEMDIG